MKVLIIGGSGLVGGNLHKLFAKDHYYTNVLATHMNFAGVNTLYYDTAKEVPEYIVNTKWNTIIHTGALTNVDLCENEPNLSYIQTVESTTALLALAKKRGAKFVYISTDYVFDGKNGPYFEHDATNPINIYGQHKLEAENLVLEYANSLVIRITNVYGDEIRKKNFLARIIAELSTNNNLTVNAPIDQFASPVNAADVAKAIDVLLKDNKIGIYHIAGTDYLSRVQLLQRINKHYNNSIKINAVKTTDLKQSALRPLVGGLACFKFINEYPTFEFSNIDDYLKK